MHRKIIFCTIVWVLSLFVWGWFCSFFRDSRECTTKWHIFWSDMSLNPIKTSCYISTIPMDKAHLNILRKIYYFWALSLVWPIWLPAAIILSWWNFHKNTYFGSQMIWASLWRCLYASTIPMDDAHIALYCVSDFGLSSITIREVIIGIIYYLVLVSLYKIRYLGCCMSWTNI